MAETSKSINYMKKASMHFDYGKGEPRKMQNAVNTVKKVWGESGTEYYRILQDLDSVAHTNLAETARLAAIGFKFNPKDQGAVRALPRFTAQGKFLGPSMIGGGVIGSAATGSMVPAVAGLAAASPITNVAAVRGAMTASHAIDGLARIVMNTANNRLVQTTVNTGLAAGTNK